jgi:hypothetical protein
VTYESPVPTEPTGAVEQQEAEVTYSDFTHDDPPTGAATQITEPQTVNADWPTPSESPHRAGGTARR